MDKETLREYRKAAEGILALSEEEQRTRPFRINAKSMLELLDLAERAERAEVELEELRASPLIEGCY